MCLLVGVLGNEHLVPVPRLHLTSESLIQRMYDLLQLAKWLAVTALTKLI